MSSSRSEAFFASAPRGLEALLEKELLSLQAKDVHAVAGGVAFSGGWETCYRANLWSRIASRVLWRVAEFGYRGEGDVYAAAKAVDWAALFPVERTLRVNVTAQKSPLKSLEFATLRIKDAVCDRFRDALGRRPDVERAQHRPSSARGRLFPVSRWSRSSAASRAASSDWCSPFLS